MPTDKESMNHYLSRCVLVEIGAMSMVGPNEFTHMDQLCEQLYFDSFGYGINREFSRKTKTGIPGAK